MRYIAIVDTETANGLNNPLVYDFGYIVADIKGNIVVKRSFINDDVFSDTRMMETAYYAEKLPMYLENKGNEWKHTTTLEMWNAFNDDIKKYGIKSGDVFAFNAQFDKRSLNLTINKYSNGFVKEFIPSDMWRDVWVIAGLSICCTAKYVSWTIDNGYITEKGRNPQTNAEVVYKYLTNNHNFNERHTALSDCEIEHFILMQCIKRHCKMPRTLGAGWAPAAKIKKNLGL